MAISKVVYGGTTLIDLTQDTAVESDVASGKYFHKADGTRVQGTASHTTNLQNKTVNLGSAAPSAVSADTGYDGLGTVSFNTTNIDGTKIKRGNSVCGVPGTFDGVDTSDANATAADIIASKTAYVNGVKLTGTAKSEETIYAEILATDWGTPLITKGGIGGYASPSLETANVYIKKDTAPSSGSDFDYEVDGDGIDYDTIPSAFTASKLYIWRGSTGEASITAPVTQTIPEGYANAYVLTPTTNITLSLRISDEDY